MILLGGYLLFGSDPGFVSICGAVIALGGMTVYTSLSLKKSSERAPNLLPKQNLASSKSKNDKDKEEKSIAEYNSSVV